MQELGGQSVLRSTTTTEYVNSNIRTVGWYGRSWRWFRCKRPKAQYPARSTMPRMTNLRSLLSQLERERRTISAQLERLNSALSALGSKASSGAQKGRISAAGRTRIAAAQRARWAKAKGEKIVPINNRKRRMSPAAIARIRAAQKARWAKWRKQQKSA
jgi:hypothetical protein